MEITFYNNGRCATYPSYNKQLGKGVYYGCSGTGNNQCSG